VLIRSETLSKKGRARCEQLVIPSFITFFQISGSGKQEKKSQNSAGEQSSYLDKTLYIQIHMGMPEFLPQT
jgi:hypothetical protein